MDDDILNNEYIIDEPDEVIEFVIDESDVDKARKKFQKRKKNFSRNQFSRTN